jgi:hypothetical protein
MTKLQTIQKQKVIDLISYIQCYFPKQDGHRPKRYQATLFNDTMKEVAIHLKETFGEDTVRKVFGRFKVDVPKMEG